MRTAAAAMYWLAAINCVTGVSCYVYSGRDPFWLLFVAQGVIVVGTAPALRKLAR